MTMIILIIHIILAVILIGTILLQRSDGGALGGIGGGGFAGVLSGRSSANFLTRLTAILAALFMCTSLLLAILAKKDKEDTILNDVQNIESENSIDTEEINIELKPVAPEDE